MTFYETRKHAVLCPLNNEKQTIGIQYIRSSYGLTPCRFICEHATGCHVFRELGTCPEYEKIIKL